jgi:flagellar hook-basal body complex protein FliE
MMRVDNTNLLQTQKVMENTPKNHKTSFADTLKQSLNEVNQMLNESDQLSEALALGQIDNVHEVMIAAEKANIALQLTVAVRNKVVEAYQELSRMQI